MFKFPYKRTFLITPDRGGTGIHDRGIGTFIPPSNMPIDLNGSTLKVKPNDLLGYIVFDFNSEVENSTIKNGKLNGNRYEHDYVAISNNSTHEWGYGVALRGTNNTVEHLEIIQMTGDGVYKVGYANNNWDNRIFKDSFQSGGINNIGVVEQTPISSIVSNSLYLNTYTENGTKNLIIEPYWGGTNVLTFDKVVKVSFYQNETFLRTIKQLVQTEIIPPLNATNFRIKFLNTLGIEFDNFFLFMLLKLVEITRLDIVTFMIVVGRGFPHPEMRMV